MKDRHDEHLERALPLIERAVEDGLGDRDQRALGHVVSVAVLEPSARAVVVAGPVTARPDGRPDRVVTTFGDRLVSLQERSTTRDLTWTVVADLAEGAPTAWLTAWAADVRRHRQRAVLDWVLALSPVVPAAGVVDPPVVATAVHRHLGGAGRVHLVVRRASLTAAERTEVTKVLRGGSVVEVDGAVVPTALVGLLVHPDRTVLHQAFGLTLAFSRSDAGIELVLQERSLLQTDPAGSREPVGVGMA